MRRIPGLGRRPATRPDPDPQGRRDLGRRDLGEPLPVQVRDLEITALVFGDRARRGGVFGIVVVIAAMMAAREIVGLLYRRALGERVTP